MESTGRSRQARLLGALAAAFAALVLALALAPATVWAGEASEGDEAEAVEAIELTSAGGELESGYYVLVEDVVLEENLTIAEGAVVTIDLAGYTLTGTGEGSVITVYGELTIEDSSSEGIVEVDYVEADAAEADGEAEEEVGVVAYTVTTDGETAAYEYVSGTVTGGVAELGGGVYVAETGVLTLAGGAIAQNEAELGGGVYVDGGTLVVTGGAIAANAAVDGAGIYNAAGVVTLGIVADDEADEAEAIDEAEDVADGIVAGNVASGNGGGVYNDNGVLELTGGTIADNEAELGGGVYNAAVVEAEAEEAEVETEAGEADEDEVAPGTFAMIGGTIADNIAADGAGVYNAFGTVVMGEEAEEVELEAEVDAEAEEAPEGLITGNVASGNGGGVYTDGALVLYAGTISGNEATVGGGVYATQDEYVVEVEADEAAEAAEEETVDEAAEDEAVDETVEDEATVIPLYAEDYEDAVFVYSDEESETDADASEPEPEADEAVDVEEEAEVVLPDSSLIATGGTIANNTAEAAADVYIAEAVDVVLDGVNAEPLYTAEGVELAFEGWCADGAEEVLEVVETGTEYYLTAVYAEVVEEVPVEEEHDYVAEVTVEATCTEEGVTTYTCSVCGDSYEEAIEALGHDYEAVVTDPTCTEEGYTTYTCTRCGDSYVDDYVEALGHSYDEAVVTVEATCTEEGVITYTCTVCGEAVEEAIEALGHDYEAVVTDPTCTEEGYTTYTCTRCGDSYVEEGEPATGHSYTTLWNWTMDYSSCTLNLTCSDDGAKIAVEAEVTYEETTADAVDDVLADEAADDEEDVVVYTATAVYGDVEYTNVQVVYASGTVTETEAAVQVSESTDLVADDTDEADVDEDIDEEAEIDEDEDVDEDEDEVVEESGSSAGTVAVVILIILAIIVVAAVIVYFVGRSKKQ